MTDHPDQPEPTDRLTLDEAAARLGISREAVRLRLRRGTLAGEKVSGVWYVSVDQRGPTYSATDRPSDRPPRSIARRADRDALVVQLRDEVAFLRRLVEHQAGRLADMEGRLLPSPVGTEEGATDIGQSVDTRPAEPPQTPATPPRRRSWWRRLTGR